MVSDTDLNDYQSSILFQDGHIISVALKIGGMSCIEYAAMQGYADILRAMLEHSINASILNQYFALDGTYTQVS